LRRWLLKRKNGKERKRVEGKRLKRAETQDSRLETRDFFINHPVPHLGPSHAE